MLLLDAQPVLPAAVDAQRVRQALDNLLENAVRHAAQRGPRRARAPAERELMLVVEDDGPGVERQLLPRLFDAFAQGGERAGGAGIGLSTVRAIAEAHGGGVSVGATRWAAPASRCDCRRHPPRRSFREPPRRRRAPARALAAAAGLALGAGGARAGRVPPGGEPAASVPALRHAVAAGGIVRAGDVVAVPIAASDRTPSMVRASARWGAVAP